MRRLYAWLAGAAGGAAAFGLLRRRRRTSSPAPAPGAGAGADPRADELRAKLDAARREPAAAADPEDGASPEPDASPEERRRRVHERGRAALDEMKPE